MGVFDLNPELHAFKYSCNIVQSDMIPKLYKYQLSIYSSKFRLFSNIWIFPFFFICFYFKRYFAKNWIDPFYYMEYLFEFQSLNNFFFFPIHLYIFFFFTQFLAEYKMCLLFSCEKILFSKLFFKLSEVNFLNSNKRSNSCDTCIFATLPRYLNICTCYI